VPDLGLQILGVLDAIDQLEIDVGASPSAGSPADVEAAGYARPMSVRTAYSTAYLALESARDHLEAVELIVRVGQPSVAHWTSLRGLMEASATAAWLFDPSIAVQERVGRSLALRFNTMSEQRKIAVYTGEAAAVAAMDTRIEELEQEATGLGFPPIRNRKGVRDGVGQRKPAISALAESEFDLRDVYSFLSAIAHCDSAVIAEFGFKRGASEGGMTTIHRDTNPEQLELALANAVMLFARPLWMKVLQYGYDRHRVTTLLNPLFDAFSLGTSASVRPWAEAQTDGS
jgi:hypothetical protein